MHHGLAVAAVLLPFRSVDWKTIRAEFMRQRGELTQEAVAKAGGLKQSYISRLESNLNRGPSVEVFVSAVAGLGMTPSSFFAQIEEREKEMTGPVRPDRDTSAAAQAQQRGGTVHGSAAVVPQGFGVSSAQDAALLREYGFAIVRAADALERDAAMRTTDRRAARGRGSTAEEPRPAASESPRRVKR